MAESAINGVLQQLASGKSDIGWSVFLQSYSPLLRDVVHHYESDDYRIQECFEFVCAGLSDHNFRRLIAFNPNGPAAFPTWLAAVCANLCIDFNRQIYGRTREPEKVRALPQLDRQVFHYTYRVGLTRQACLQALCTRFPSVTLGEISEIRGRIHLLLSPRQRWVLSKQRRTQVSLDDPDVNSTEEVSSALQSSEARPDLLVEIEQDHRRLRKAMAHLEPRQRLLLTLRFQQDLTLERVAMLSGISSPSQASREIDRALAALAEAMKF
jgi:RNA polymerase sigma factor (sigma-70 family)